MREEKIKNSKPQPLSMKTRQNKIGINRQETMKLKSNHYFIDLTQVQKPTGEITLEEQTIIINKQQREKNKSLTSLNSLNQIRNERKKQKQCSNGEIETQQASDPQSRQLSQMKIDNQSSILQGQLNQSLISRMSMSGYLSPRSDYNSNGGQRTMFNFRNFAKKTNDLSHRNQVLENTLSKSFTQNKEQIQEKIKSESQNFNPQLRQTYDKLNQFEREWSTNKQQRTNSRQDSRPRLSLNVTYTAKLNNRFSKSPSPLNTSRNSNDMKLLDQLNTKNKQTDENYQNNKYQSQGQMTSTLKDNYLNSSLNYGYKVANQGQKQKSPSPNSSLLFNKVQELQQSNTQECNSQIKRSETGKNFFNLSKQTLDNFERIKQQYSHISQQSTGNEQNKSSSRKDSMRKSNDTLTDRLIYIKQFLETGGNDNQKLRVAQVVDINLNSNSASQNFSQRNSLQTKNHNEQLLKVFQVKQGVQGRNQQTKFNFWERRRSENTTTGIKTLPLLVTKSSKIYQDSKVQDIKISAQQQSNNQDQQKSKGGNTSTRNLKVRNNIILEQTPLSTIQRKVINLNLKPKEPNYQLKIHDFNQASNKTTNFNKQAQPKSQVDTPLAQDSTTQCSSMLMTNRTQKSDESIQKCDQEKVLEKRINSLLKETKNEIKRHMNLSQR